MSETEQPFEETVERAFLELPQCSPLDKDLFLSNYRMLERIKSLVAIYELEITEERSTGYDPEAGKHFVLYRYDDSDDERVYFEDEPEVALLTLMQEAVGVLQTSHSSLREGDETAQEATNAHPTAIENIDLVNTFWEQSKQNKDFDAMHQRLEDSEFERLVLRSYMEQIAQVPLYLREDGTILRKFIDDLQSENDRIAANYRQDVNTTEPRFMDDMSVVKEIPDETPEVDTVDNNTKRKKSNALVGGIVVFTALTSLIAACTLTGSNDNSNESLVPLVEPEIPISAETTSSTIEDINLITESQAPILTAPEVAIDTTTTELVTTTTTTSTTIPPTTTSELTSVTIASTFPVPEKTVPSLPTPTIPQNDGVLSKAQCDAKGGFQHRFQGGEYLYPALQNIYGIQENQAASLLKNHNPLIVEYHLSQITASTPGQIGAECMPDKSTIKPLLTKPIFVTTTTTTG